MTYRRLAQVLFGFILALALLGGRILWLSTEGQYAVQAQAQSMLAIDMPRDRGVIFDSEWRILTGADSCFYALATPGENSYAELFECVNGRNQSLLFEHSKTRTPFFVKLAAMPLNESVYIYKAQSRYLALPVAAHIIGYTDENGKGLTGIERAFDELLSTSNPQKQLIMQVTARRGMAAGKAFAVEEAAHGSGQGLMLTIDALMQRSCEAIAQQHVPKGSIVVLDSATGEVKACVSTPFFDPNNIAQSIINNDSSLFNRSINAYNVGSVFKPLMAAAALEAGYGSADKYYCTGTITVGDHDYHCARTGGHGEVDMLAALEYSCNCYFINLGQHIKGQSIALLASAVKFGIPVQLAKNFYTQAGNFPSATQLQDSGALAGISFGQGTLLASPVQMAGYINIFANGGLYVEPKIAKAVVDAQSKTVVEQLIDNTKTTQVISGQTAEKVKTMLISVVENGLGKKAKPATGVAGGKTGTAQTGKFSAVDGHEIYDAWFTGFYEVNGRTFTIVVMLEDGGESGETAAPVFAHVCNALEMLTR